MIESSLFRGCKWLTEIVIPPQLLEIKEGAFENCSSLISVELPNSIEKLGDEYGPVAYGSGGVFQKLHIITRSKYPKESSIFRCVYFFGCSTIDNIRIPKNITKTGYYGNFLQNVILLSILLLMKVLQTLRKDCFIIALV